MRPTISLACILKNEENQLPRFLENVDGLFDEIVLVDTGSTDKSVEIIQEFKKTSKSKIITSYFEWVYDFSKARQVAFDLATCNYVMWLDLDDEITDREAFLKFRDNVMHAADCWHVNYQYATDASGNAACEFIRERIVKNNKTFEWRFFLHEGLVYTGDSQPWVQRVSSWQVKHLRTQEDFAKDKGRNLTIFEKNLGAFTTRDNYYYGKELHDVGRHKEASKYLMEAAKAPDCQPHDRMMAMQYAAQSAIHCEAYEQAKKLCHDGLLLYPTRAEFYCILGDLFLKERNMAAAITNYIAARNCPETTLGGSTFAYKDAYGSYPSMQMANIYLSVGDIKKASEQMPYINDVNVKAQIQMQMEKMDKLTRINPNAAEVNEIIITTPPYSIIGEWDEDDLKTKGLGGSETAAVEVAKYLHEISGLKVKIFNARKEFKKAPSGVEYIPVQELAEYLWRYKPVFHIAWRHSVRLTNAPSFVWSHDLFTPGSEKLDFDKLLCLTEFHKHYVQTLQKIPDDKINIFRNGIDPKLWQYSVTGRPVKNPYKVIFSSSPDRGMDRVIRIVKRAREISGLDLELHLFYGFDNMRKSGMGAVADKFEAMIEENKAFVKYHGNVDKQTLINHFMESAVWLYPANFIETFCITALEALASKCYPMVRRMGALNNTLHDAETKGHCWITETDCNTEEEVDYWAENLVNAIVENRWKDVTLDIEKHSWKSVSEDLWAMFKEYKGM